MTRSGLLEPQFLSELDTDGERLLCDVIWEAKQLLVGDPEPDAVGDLEPALLPQQLDVADQVVAARLESELVVEADVERDGDGAVRRDRPALFADPLDEHLLRLEHVAVHLEPSVLELLEPALRERRPDLRERRAELRPEHTQVRLHAQLRRLDLPEQDLLD